MRTTAALRFRGSCPHKVLRGQRQGAALHPRLCGGHVSQRARLRGERQRALPSGLPLGPLAPDPEMLTHLHFACGRDGGFGAQTIDDTMLTSPPKGGRAGR